MCYIYEQIFYDLQILVRNMDNRDYDDELRELKTKIKNIVGKEQLDLIKKIFEYTSQSSDVLEYMPVYTKIE